jgi:hypothetical protein
LTNIEKLQQTPDDVQSLRWLVAFSLQAAKTYELQYVYYGMFKHAQGAEAAFVKMEEKGILMGPGSPYNEWRLFALQECRRAWDKMLEVGMHQQWVAEMEARTEGDDWEEESGDEEDEQQEESGINAHVDDTGDGE